MKIDFNHGGFVALTDKMVSPVDLKVVNSARISMGKQTEEMGERDERLIRFLAENEHTTPFRHSYVTFHIKAPIFVLRQWMKHQVGCSWNEISGRYVEFEPDDMWSPSPDEWRESADSVKQGSGGALGVDLGEVATQTFDSCLREAYESYRALISLGVCREQARACLPVALFSECYWTASLQAVGHFLKLRLDSHAQLEIREYAAAVKAIICEEVKGAALVLEALNE